jgi:hypothetical protein
MRRLTLKKQLGRALGPAQRQLFRMLQTTGWHLTRNHFYEPVPDTRRLPASLWSSPSELPGLDMREDAQLDLLNTFERYISDAAYPVESQQDPLTFYLDNEYFKSFDAEVLHCLICDRQPRHIIEVGSGFSTLVMRQAAPDVHIVSVEPFPDAHLRQIVNELVAKPVEQVPPEWFRLLEPGDILFIDSSHVVRIGGDVLHLYLEVLPRLRPGVLVHIHDIFLPFPYPRRWVLGEHKFWTEQWLLQAFLAFNNSFHVIWASAFMRQRHEKRLRALFPQWRTSEPSSFWMMKC